MTDAANLPADLRGKVIVVTGAGGGIGKEIALASARAGAQVTLRFEMDTLVLFHTCPPRRQRRCI